MWHRWTSQVETSYAWQWTGWTMRARAGWRKRCRFRALQFQGVEWNDATESVDMHKIAQQPWFNIHVMHFLYTNDSIPKELVMTHCLEK